MDALDGLQDLAAKPEGGANTEGSPGHTPPQVSQVTALEEPTHTSQDGTILSATVPGNVFVVLHLLHRNYCVCPDSKTHLD